MSETDSLGADAANQRLARQEAVDFARSSIELSGFSITKEHEAHAKRWIDGEIEWAEFVAAPNARNDSA